MNPIYKTESNSKTAQATNFDNNKAQYGHNRNIRTDSIPAHCVES